MNQIFATNSNISQFLNCLHKKMVSLEQSNHRIFKNKITLLAANRELTSLKKREFIPGARSLCTDAKATVAAPIAELNKAANNTEKPKTSKEKPGAESKDGAGASELPIDVGRLDMRVGIVIEIGCQPDADTLYVEKIDCGELMPRTVVSGLVKFISIEEMQNRMVVVLCNLKPAKLRGITFEAMVMCASTPEKVEVLSPPENSVPGDLVHCEGFARQPDAIMNPKKKIFETCAPDLKTNDFWVACYKNAILHVPGKGNVMTQPLKNIQVK